MTGRAGTPGDAGGRPLDDRPLDVRSDALRQVLARWRESRARSAPRADEPPQPPQPPQPTPAPHAPQSPAPPGPADDPTSPLGAEIDLVDVEVLRSGRPGLVDVVAQVDGRLAHVVLSLRSPGDEIRVLGALEEPGLGDLEDADGVAVALDALHDADAARLLLGAVAGNHPPATLSRAARGAPAHRGTTAIVSVLRDDDGSVTLAFDRQYSLSVFPWLHHGPHPGATMLAGLDEAGFNHVPAPVAFWRRAGMDLGVVQELLVGASGGWALALTSLRDLLASGVSPDAAGGDFAPEALALGTMTARMHMALERAFGRRAGDARAWAKALEGSLPTESLDALAESGLHPPTIRTHGDFHLGRTARTDHGWVLTDCMPGGTAPETGSDEPVYRSPLADVADFTWSLGRAAAVAAAERGPLFSPSRVSELARMWEARNRRAFVAAYLATPGIGGLVPADRRVVRRLLSMFEAARAARAARGDGLSTAAG